MELVKVIEKENIKNNYPEVEVGDYVKAHLKISEIIITQKEKDRTGVQYFLFAIKPQMTASAGSLLPCPDENGGNRALLF